MNFKVFSEKYRRETVGSDQLTACLAFLLACSRDVFDVDEFDYKPVLEFLENRERFNASMLKYAGQFR